jgi:hypothetical protein
LTSLSELQAAALARREGYLFLDGLTTLSDAQAEEFAKHGKLSLKGLTVWESGSLAKRLFDENDACLPSNVASISARVAQIFAEHDGQLDLDGLQAIGQDVAEALSPHKGTLLLNGLSEITAEVGRALAKHQGTLGLMGLTELSADVADELCVLAAESVNARPGIHKCLADRRSYWLEWLNQLPALTDAAMVRLAHFRGDLSLDGLKSLSETEAPRLVNRGELLSLNGLSSVSNAVAEVLAQHSGRLSLDGIKTLSDEAAATLAISLGDLNTSGWPTSAVHAYNSTREAALLALRYAADPASVDLSQITDLSAEQSRVLARTGWYLNLAGITSLNEEAARILACHSGSLNLMNLRDISEEGARALAGHQGPVVLALDQLPSQVAAAFEKARPAHACAPAEAVQARSE